MEGFILKHIAFSVQIINMIGGDSISRRKGQFKSMVRQCGRIDDVDADRCVAGTREMFDVGWFHGRMIVGDAKRAS